MCYINRIGKISKHNRHFAAKLQKHTIEKGMKSGKGEKEKTTCEKGEKRKNRAFVSANFQTRLEKFYSNLLRTELRVES